MKNNLSLSSLIIGISLIISVVFASLTIKEIKKDKKTITVKGYAEQAIKSDIAVWAMSLSVNSPDLASGAKKLDEHREKLIKYLKGEGISVSQMGLSSVSSSERYKLNDKGRTTNQIESYLLSQTLEVTSENVHKIGQLSHMVSNLIKDGLDINSYSPRFLVSAIEKYKIDLLRDASVNARKRADVLVGSVDEKVMGIDWANQGVFQITPLNSTEVANYGMYDTSTIKKTIKAVITVRFIIE